MCRYQSYYTENPNPTNYCVVAGQVSGDMYFLEYLDTEKTMVRRETSSGAQVWGVYIHINLDLKAFAALSDESEIIYTGYPTGYYTIIRINAANGAIIQRLETNVYESYKDWMQNVPTSDNTAIYSSAYVLGGTEPVICKLVLGSLNINCFTATGMSNGNAAFTLISNTELFNIWLKSDGSTNLIFQRLTWGSTTPSWSKEVGCPDGSSCSFGYSHVIMSADSTQVYTLTAFGQTRHAYLIVVDAATGDVVHINTPLILKSSVQ